MRGVPPRLQVVMEFEQVSSVSQDVMGGCGGAPGPEALRQLPICLSQYLTSRQLNNDNKS